MTKLGRKPLDPAKYQKALAFYAAHPGKCVECARVAGISRELARRWWDGKPYTEPKLAELFPVPIRAVLEREAVQATALKRRQEAEERLRQEEAERRRYLQEMQEAREERVKARAEEQRLVQATRTVAGGLLAAFGDLVPAVHQMARVARTELAKKVAAGTLTLEEATARIRDITNMAERVGKMVAVANNEGRASRGEPTQVVELQPAPPAPQQYQGALDQVRRAAQVLAIAERTPHLVLEVQGEEQEKAAQG